MILLFDKWVINLFIVRINFPESLNLISWVLSFNWFYLALIHMVKNCDFIFYEINWKLSDLFMWWFFLIFFELLCYFQNHYFFYMLIHVSIIFAGSVFLHILAILSKSTASKNNTVISILIFLDSLLPNFLNSFNKPIMISVRIIGYSSESSINLHNFFPMWHFTWTV